MYNASGVGQDAADYFNKLLTKYDTLDKFMYYLAMEMWGDRINCKFLIPAGDQIGSHNRDFLQPKDPTGFNCLESKSLSI